MAVELNKLLDVVIAQDANDLHLAVGREQDDAGHRGPAQLIGGLGDGGGVEPGDRRVRVEVRLDEGLGFFFRAVITSKRRGCRKDYNAE